MTDIDLAALRLSVRYDEGDGPAIVMLHGINSDATDWRRIIDRIGGGYRCIAVDLLGFGDSPKPLDIDYTADEHATVLDATLGELDIADRFVLVGYSLGGDIAIRYAARHPEKIRRLFLLSTPFYLPPEQYSSAKFGPTYLTELAEGALWRAIAGQKERGGLLYSVASGRLEEFSKGFLRTEDVPTHWDIMSKNLTNCIGRATFVEDLPRLTMPVVFALGVRDPIVRPDQTPALKRLMPEMEIRRIVGLTADHFMLLNLPERVADEIMRDEVASLSVPFHGGKGEPLVLLHAIESTAEQWRPAGVALAKKNDVAIVELLGFGASAAPLSSLYTLEDHAAAVWATVRKLYGDRPVRFAGHGFGATVALQCAAERPGAVSEVIALSPALAPSDAEDADAVAEVRESLEAFRSAGNSERMQAVASEQLEARIVPRLRSLAAVLAVDARALLDRLTVPVIVVAPDGDRQTPRQWLHRYAAEHPDRFSVVDIEGTRMLPFEKPVAAAKVIEPGSEEVLKAARREQPIEVHKTRTVTEMLQGANSLLFRRGALMLVAGTALLLVRSIPSRLIPLALAVWLLVEALQIISGAFDLRRSGKSWLGWLLVGIVSFAFALFITVRDAFALQLSALAIALWLLGRGVADLVVARRAARTPGRRWLLVAEGLLGVALGLLVLLAPAFGGRLFRYTLGAYLAAGGAVTIGYAWSVHRATVMRLRRVLRTA